MAAGCTGDGSSCAPHFVSQNDRGWNMAMSAAWADWGATGRCSGKNLAWYHSSICEVLKGPWTIPLGSLYIHWSGCCCFCAGAGGGAAPFEAWTWAWVGGSTGSRGLVIRPLSRDLLPSSSGLSTSTEISFHSSSGLSSRLPRDAKSIAPWPAFGSEDESLAHSGTSSSSLFCWTCGVSQEATSSSLAPSGAGSRVKAPRSSFRISCMKALLYRWVAGSLVSNKTVGLTPCPTAPVLDDALKEDLLAGP
mmetsp:Transcript_3302/g.11613  ORF Transcript_3302/g.11613 Transcript_3302/m.11613 type:complete len:249 (+) Transcript_3302:94-840(+)